MIQFCKTMISCYSSNLALCYRYSLSYKLFLSFYNSSTTSSKSSTISLSSLHYIVSLEILLLQFQLVQMMHYSLQDLASSSFWYLSSIQYYLSLKICNSLVYLAILLELSQIVPLASQSSYLVCQSSFLREILEDFSSWIFFQRVQFEKWACYNQYMYPLMAFLHPSSSFSIASTFQFFIKTSLLRNYISLFCFYFTLLYSSMDSVNSDISISRFLIIYLEVCEVSLFLLYKPLIIY